MVNVSQSAAIHQEQINDDISYLIVGEAVSINKQPMQIQYENEELQSDEQDKQTPTQDDLSLSLLEPKLPDQIRHKVVYGDTLEGLSLEYEVAVSRIKQRNHIDSEQIYHLKYIIIPEPKVVPEKKEQTQDLIAEEFVSLMDYSQKSHMAAKYYLSENDWDVDKAFKEYQEDREWEKSRQGVPASQKLPGDIHFMKMREYFDEREMQLKRLSRIRQQKRTKK